MAGKGQAMQLNPDEGAFLSALINAPAETTHRSEIEVESFVEDINRAVYQAVLDVASRSETVTSALVQLSMQSAGVDPQRAAHAVASLNSKLASFSPIADANILRMALRERRVVTGLSQAAQAAQMDVDQGIKLASDTIDQTGQSGLKVWTGYELYELSQQEQIGVNVNVPVVGRAITKLEPGSMTVVGGQTGAYKSSFSLYMAQRFETMGLTPGIVSLEDPPFTWGERVDYQFGDRLAASRIRYACLDWHRLEAVTEAMRTLVFSHGCNALFIDYVQLISRGDMRGATRAQVISSIAKDLKTACKRMDVPLVLISQISRPEHGARWREPTIFDLKETGDLENSAENIILLWKDGDEDDSRVFGKVGKVKRSSRRPRFELLRDASGAVVDPVEYTPPQAPEQERGGLPRRGER